MDAAEPPRSAPVHRAPPEGWRPLSGLAVTVFVVSLFAVLLSLSGVVLITAFLLLVQAIVLGTVRWSARRGRGLVLVAMGITLLTGLFGYVQSVTARDVLEDRAAELLAALRGGDAKAVDGWVDEGARKQGAADRIRARYAEVTKEMGPYRGPVEAGDLWLGVSAAVLPPPKGAEVPQPAPNAKEPPEGTIWVRATFEKAQLHVALVPRGAGSGKGQFEKTWSVFGSVFGPKTAEGLWEDVRFYRAP